MRKRNEKHLSRIFGVLLIITSVLVFVSSLQKRMKRVTETGEVAVPPEIRITADGKTNLLYLWGMEEGVSLKASVSMHYSYKDGFYIISIENIFEPYLLEAYKGADLKSRFSYRPGESYPIFPY